MPRALCALVPHVPCALCTSVPHVPRAIRALVLDVPLALRAPGFQVPGAFTCSRVLRVLGTLVPHVSCALCRTFFFGHRPSLASVVSSLTYSYESHV